MLLLFSCKILSNVKRACEHVCCVLIRVCVSQTGVPGGETEGMGTQEPAGGGGAARLFPGALPGPRAANGPQPHQQHTTRCQWQRGQRDL